MGILYIKMRKNLVRSNLPVFALLMLGILVPTLVKQSNTNARAWKKGGGATSITYFNGSDWVDAKLVKLKADSIKDAKKLFYFNGIVWVDAGLDESSLGGQKVPVVDLSKPRSINDYAPEKESGREAFGAPAMNKNLPPEPLIKPVEAPVISNGGGDSIAKAITKPILQPLDKLNGDVKKDIKDITKEGTDFANDPTKAAQKKAVTELNKVENAADPTKEAQKTVSPFTKFASVPEPPEEKPAKKGLKGLGMPSAPGMSGAPSAPTPPMDADAMKKYIDEQVQAAVAAKTTEATKDAAEENLAKQDTAPLSAANQKLLEELKEKEKLKADLDAQMEKQHEAMKAAMMNATPGKRDTIKLDENRSIVREEKLALSTQVFGWQPYWMGESYKSLDFSLLTTVAYYGYEIDPNTGGFTSVHDWNKTDLQDMAQKKHCKVVLTATATTEKDVSTFLANKDAQKNFIETIRTLVVARNGNGVNIDLQNLNVRYKAEFVEFLKNVSKAFKSLNTNYQISVNVPAIDIAEAYDAKALEGMVDYFVIMGYENSTTNVIADGASSPFGIFSGNSLATAIDIWLARKIEPTKMILSMPNYGMLWQSDVDLAPSHSAVFLKKLTYAEIVQQYAGKTPDFYEPAISPYYHGRSTSAGKFEQCWFDNDHSLNAKYNIVTEKKLGGVGIWGLGMNGDDKMPFSIIEAKFVKLTSVPLDTIKFNAALAHNGAHSSLYKWFRQKANRLYGLIRRPSTFNPNQSSLAGFLKIFMILGGITFLTMRFMFIYRKLQMGDKWKEKNYFIYIMLLGFGIFAVCIIMYAYLTMFFQKIYHSKGFLFTIGMLIGVLICLIFVLYIVPRLLRNKELP